MEMSERKPLLSYRVLYLPTDALHPNPHQPRRDFDEGALRELSESIRRYGILQPLTVRRTENGYELIAGERRLRAAKLAGLREVPCLLARSSEEESALLALIEISSAATCTTLKRPRPLRSSSRPTASRRSRRRKTGKIAVRRRK